ncbi:seipin-like isoform X2 [Haliotis asinina]|uniref:seipin-like isoform X2 n=1 Tax=Haliotis asinina TaxID=109174 RepID=UPI0035325227
MVIDLFGNIVDWGGIFLQVAFSKLKTIFIRLFILIGVLITILWLSIFFYASFYWLYMPSASHIRPVYFKFDVCPEGAGICTFPQANLTFGEDGREEILHKGQAYRIYLELEMPESPTNRGMFMVRLQMYDKKGTVIQQSDRAAILHYRSVLLRTMYTLVFAPFFLAGLDEQKQVVDIELFNHYVDDLVDSAVGAIIQIQTKKIEIYSSKIKIFADFTGLRYYMFYWPKFSAVSGIVGNFTFLAFMALLSWYQYSQKDTVEEEEFVPMMRRMSLDVRRQRIREQLERERGAAADSSSPEDEEETTVKSFVESHDYQGSHDYQESHGIQDESLGEMAAVEDDDIVLMSSDVMLPGSDDSNRLRLRRPSNIEAVL